ncbi:50S ribosomal protein L24 [[Ruminococcus] torques]|nr:50S ribosomal protein L24 [[Ruminococcus] torques]
MKIKTGDTVKVIAGKDKDKEGKVIAVNKKDGRVLVEGVNMLTKHTKPSAANQNGGIVHQEGYIDASNVMLMHKGQATRVGFKMDGDKKFVSQRRLAKLLINSGRRIKDFE